ncbi:MAG: hypothetical protein IJF84_00460 [Thermoguttaceae bacterium]|nr:hypothetical protein [Thermoguttaceae bacterium]
MLKIVDNSSFDWGDEPLGSIIKVSSEGLVGADRQEFVKRASGSLLDTVDSIKVNPGEELVHLIALGTTEDYGPNRNGDGFKKKACEDYHHYFVKDAKVYRNHKNTDPENSYGVVKASAFNEDMSRVELIVALNRTKEAAKRNKGHVADKELDKLESDKPLACSMACVRDPKYPILTRDRGYVAIEDITTDDYVWTKDSGWKRVTQINRRKYTGDTYKIHFAGLPFPLEITADHLLAAKIAPKNLKSRLRPDYIFKSAPIDWVRADELVVKDYIACKPITYSNCSEHFDSEEIGVLLGYYLAEGNTCYSHGKPSGAVEFTCNINDELPVLLPKMMAIAFPSLKVSTHPHSGSKLAMGVHVHNKEFAELFDKYIGHGVKNKRIPPEMFNSPENVKLAFLAAWMDGDGFCDAKGGHWSMCNPNLALQGRDLLLSMGIRASIYKIDHASCPTSGMPNSGDEYTLNISRSYLNRLSKYSRKAREFRFEEQAPPKFGASMRDCGNGLYAYRIKKIEKDHIVDTVVYNFEVEDDPSYSAAGLVSHNCRVPFDVCSYCGNKASTREEYCEDVKDGGHCKAGGLKENLGKIVKVGGELHHLHADNTKPYFFDISHVFVPADRIAYASGFCKKASADTTMGGAELAELYGMSMPEKKAGYDYQQENANTKLLRVLFDAVTDFHDNKAWVKVATYLPVIDVKPLTNPETVWQYKQGAITKGLNDAHICLTPTQFVQLEYGLPVKEASVIGEVIGPLSNERFKELLVSDSVYNPYMPAKYAAPRIQDWCYHQKCARWNGNQSFIKQAACNSIATLPPVTMSRETIYSFDSDTTVKNISHDYALYKVAFLSSIPEGQQKQVADMLVGRDYISY